MIMRFDKYRRKIQRLKTDMIVVGDLNAKNAVEVGPVGDVMGEYVYEWAWLNNFFIINHARQPTTFLV